MLVYTILVSVLTTLGRIVFEATPSQQCSIMTNNMSDLDKFLYYGLLRRSDSDSSDLDRFLYDGQIPCLPQKGDLPPPRLIKKTQKDEDSQLRSVVPQPEPEPSSNEHEAFLTDNPATTGAQLLPVTETASEFLEKLLRLQSKDAGKPAKESISREAGEPANGKGKGKGKRSTKRKRKRKGKDKRKDEILFKANKLLPLFKKWLHQRSSSSKQRSIFALALQWLELSGNMI